MTKVLSGLRKHIKLILISAAVLAAIVVFAILKTQRLKFQRELRLFAQSIPCMNNN